MTGTRHLYAFNMRAADELVHRSHEHGLEYAPGTPLATSHPKRPHDTTATGTTSWLPPPLTLRSSSRHLLCSVFNAEQPASTPPLRRVQWWVWMQW